MKYKYNIVLNKSEALYLKLILKEPITEKYPSTTEWEVLENDFGELYIMPKMFVKTKAFRWAMHPNQEFKASIVLNTPLTPETYFELTDLKLFLYKGFKKTRCLKSKKGKPSDNSLYWHPKDKCIRSNNEK